jgi:hypothetical protein
MFFLGFLALIALGIIAWWIRSPIARQLRRGRGFDASASNRLVGHHLDRGHYRTPTWNDDGHGGTRESTRVSKELGPQGRRD